MGLFASTLVKTVGLYKISIFKYPLNSFCQLEQYTNTVQYCIYIHLEDAKGRKILKDKRGAATAVSIIGVQNATKTRGDRSCIKRA